MIFVHIKRIQYTIIWNISMFYGPNFPSKKGSEGLEGVSWEEEGEERRKGFVDREMVMICG